METLDRRWELEAKYKKQVLEKYGITEKEYEQIVLEACEKDWPER